MAARCIALKRNGCAEPCFIKCRWIFPPIPHLPHQYQSIQLASTIKIRCKSSCSKRNILDGIDCNWSMWTRSCGHLFGNRLNNTKFTIVTLNCSGNIDQSNWIECVYWPNRAFFSCCGCGKRRLHYCFLLLHSVCRLTYETCELCFDYLHRSIGGIYNTKMAAISD